MPHENGKVFYITKNGKRYGVSLLDVANALMAASLDLGTLCRHPNIDIWAMHKPVGYPKPGALTDAEKRSRQYGLVVPVRPAAQAPGAAAPKWTYERPTEWFRLDDFVGETEGEGYSAYAPPTAAATLSATGKGLTAEFRFLGSRANGGIPASEMPVNGVNKLLSELYAGVVIFRSDDGVNFRPAYIATLGAKIGSTATARMGLTLNNILGNGAFAAYAIMSPTPYITDNTLSGVSHNVAYIHDAMLHFAITDAWGGLELLSRRYVGQEYYSRPGGVSPVTAPGSDPVRYYWDFLAGHSLSLTPAREFRSLAADDKRLAVSLNLTPSGSSYGLGGWCPISSGFASIEEFDAIRTQARALPVCSWPTVVGEAALLLKYEPVNPFRQMVNGSLQWEITYRRRLVLVDDSERELYAGPYADKYTFTVSGTSLAVNTPAIEPIKKIRFGNAITANGSFNSIAGMYFALGDGSPASDTTSAVRQCGIDSEDYGELSFFAANIERVTRGTNGSVMQTAYIPNPSLPVETRTYIDITIDTADSAEDLE